jgi:hypothetical protein
VRGAVVRRIVGSVARGRSAAAAAAPVAVAVPVRAGVRPRAVQVRVALLHNGCGLLFWRLETAAYVHLRVS